MTWDLHYHTPRTWAASVAAHVPTLLLDQVHLEKKAAAAANAFLFRMPSHVPTHLALSRLAREELVHFERALRLLEQRGLPFTKLEPGPYMERLKEGVSKVMPERLLDELLFAALIEARSHERLSLLAEELRERDAEAAAFYADLLESEYRHREIYVEAAEAVFPDLPVMQRLERMLVREAEIMRALPFMVRLHGGCLEGV